MKFKWIEIKNFRNFKEIKVDLTNQNVIFGLNDIGKSNFLAALRFLFEREIRKNGFIESDFYIRDVDEEISITICIDIKDFDVSDHSKLIVSRMAGARSSEDLENIYIRLNGVYEKNEEIGGITVYWGNSLEKLKEIPQKNGFTELDRIFKVVYIDPLINLERVFEKNKRAIFNQEKFNAKDIEKSEKIKEFTKEINKSIGEMDVINNFEGEITREYQSLKHENIRLTIKSEMAINGYFSDLKPYIKREDDDNLYPTSGDGRKKIISYSLLNYVTKNFNSEKITIFLIEEPENSLHRSLQIALSKKLFSNEAYKYFFLTTHSPELLYEMDNASLIRIHSMDKIVCSSSYVYVVGDDYRNIKTQLNKNLVTALFSERVLLIEGPSERVLFEKVLGTVKPEYELNGAYILEVYGIAFKKYWDVLRELGINVFVKTDNDLKRKKNTNNIFDLIGFNRALELCGKRKMPPINITFNESDTKDLKSAKIVQEKRRLFQKLKTSKRIINSNNIYISTIDLEHDLHAALGARLEELTGNSNPIKYLQSAKLINMAELAKELTYEDCKHLYDHPKFAVLKELNKHEGE
ncbi:ATP-dependent endonuclease [Bhargavaea cecembensis]|uniref:ATP-dependent endonuclease n=1 Tax=Bhargavaea cecembensis TaxID=394098 RepID=A0A161SNG2_9BACL|nr:AAA family ATPase [Bhargavaea cecembensis]KZE36450.1 ATP-dependent endonuclease [Bhargavaea cecembensis]